MVIPMGDGTGSFKMYLSLEIAPEGASTSHGPSSSVAPARSNLQDPLVCDVEGVHRNLPVAPHPKPPIPLAVTGDG